MSVSFAKSLTTRPAAVVPNYSGLTFRGTIVDNTTATSNSYPGFPIGSANVNRIVIVALLMINAPSITGFTMNGVTVFAIGAGPAFMGSVPTGTTCDFAWTLGGNPAGTIVGVWTVNMTDATPFDMAGYVTTEAVPSVSIPAGGFCLLATQNNSTTDTSVTFDQSFVSDFEDFAPIALFNAAFAHREVTGAFTGTVTADWATSAQIYNSWWSFRGVP